MKVLLKKKNLFLRVAIGFVLGVILGLAVPGFSIAAKVVGDIYLNPIKLMIIPIVVCAVFCGIANIKDGSLLRRIGVRTVLLYVVMFIVCTVISLAVAWVIRPGPGTLFDNAPKYTGACRLCCIVVFLVAMALPVGLYTRVSPVKFMKACGIPGGGVAPGASFLSIPGLPIDLMDPISGFCRLPDMAFTPLTWRAT